MEIYFGLASIPVILALTQVVKPFIADKRFYPVIAVFLGLIFNIGVGYSIGADIAQSSVLGVLAGLSASGLYSTGATLTAGEAAKKKIP